MSYTLGMDRRGFFKRAGQIIGGGIIALLVKPKKAIDKEQDFSSGRLFEACVYDRADNITASGGTGGSGGDDMGLGGGGYNWHVRLLDTSKAWGESQAKEAQRLIDNNVIKSLHKG